MVILAHGDKGGAESQFFSFIKGNRANKQLGVNKAEIPIRQI